LLLLLLFVTFVVLVFVVVVMAKSGRRTVDPVISSFTFTTGNEERIRSLQLQQQAAADSDADEDQDIADQVRHTTGQTAALNSLDDLIATAGPDHMDLCALLLSRSTIQFGRGNHQQALDDANECLTKSYSAAALFCKGRALAGLSKYGPAELAFRQAQSVAGEDSLKYLIERELRHLRYNALKSLELKDSSGQKWDNPIEAFRISRRENVLNDAINSYANLTEPKTRNWNDAKTTLCWNQPPAAVAPAPVPSDSAHLTDEYHRISPLPIGTAAVKKAVAPPPGFPAPATKAPGPIQRPAPAAAPAAATNNPVRKTAAQLLSSNNAEWQTAGSKIRVKPIKPEISALPTNVYGCEGVWVGGISPKASGSDLLDIFKRYGVIKTYNIGKSKDANYMFISYDAVIPPAKAVKEMNGVFVKKITVTQENPLIVRFEPSQSQRPIFQTWSLEKTKEKCHAKGECFSWRTKEGCFNLTDCPYAHHDRNRGVDSCSWLNKTKK
jgi:hypothetical protein